MALSKTNASSPFSRLFVPKQVAHNDEKLRKICTNLRSELSLIKSVVSKQGRVKQDDKRHVIKVIGDIIDDILQNDRTLSPDARRRLVNMAVSILWSDPEVGVVRLESEEAKVQKPPKQVDFNNRVAYIPPPKVSTAQRLQRAVSNVDLKLTAKKTTKMLRRQASMPAMPALPHMTPSPEV
ncbi:uncharacterized protein PV09_00263 [Verruconis gallopava]|uniref:Uncharacterized protein n=1 Tax=Verruconis gallopava TaxID=253628 RepID=A0A0D2AS46_9PEZI|nr:uncharacterized protein PV09_00263 [Verruconis gallopava]KIW09365.1 hypothetical protein PV09_00263 [Verruconis gallopava]